MDETSRGKFHIKKDQRDTTGFAWHYWHDREDRDYGSTAQHADAVANVAHAIKTGS